MGLKGTVFRANPGDVRDEACSKARVARETVTRLGERAYGPRTKTENTGAFYRVNTTVSSEKKFPTGHAFG